VDGVRLGLAILVVGWILLAGRCGYADSVWTDANIVTGLDLSGSIEARDAEIQIEGIALAIRSPEIITAIHNGRHRRIGFAVFVWAEGNYPVLDAWRLIRSQQDAAAVSEEVLLRLRAILDSDVLVKPGALTDLSGAIDYGGEALRAAPFAASRQIINIVSNGIDNVGEGTPSARDRLVAQGVTINGVALGFDRTIYEYFRREVIGGPEAFVLRANDPSVLVDVLARKFVTEIAFNIHPAAQPER
jgi:Ca-activated chloride channel homolog